MKNRVSFGQKQHLTLHAEPHKKGGPLRARFHLDGGFMAIGNAVTNRKAQTRTLVLGREKECH